MSSDLQIARLQRILGYRFHDEALLLQALTHRSSGTPNNERLEFLGDAILGLEISVYLYDRHPYADEGQLSRMRAQLVKRDTLASIAKELEFGDHLSLGTGELRSGGQTRDSILADSVEALIAAVYLDGKLDEARALIHRLFGERMATVDPATQRKDPKTRLQEYLQGQGRDLPQYTVTEITGVAHDQTFLVSCTLNNPQRVAEGRGGSRRKAEQAAANVMLTQIESEES